MKAVVWSKEKCQMCIQAKALLANKGIEYEERVIGEGWTKEQLLELSPSARSVPQIFVDGKYVGGFNELRSFLNGNN